MKKMFFVLLSVLIVAGAWAQSTIPTPTFPAAPAIDAGSTFVENFFDVFDVVSAESVESKTSQGIFTSMVDDYIGVNSYDPQTGTFVFLGGGSGLSDTTHVSFGIGKTLSFGYLGVYYGGHLVKAEGTDSAMDYNESPPDDTYYSYHDAEWDNKLAVLFGTSALGAFRLDLNLSQRDHKVDVNGALLQAIAYGDTNPSIALTWGGLDIAGLTPYATIGIQLPTTYTIGTRDNANNKNYSVDVVDGGFFGIQAGVSHDSGLWGDLSLLFQLESSAKGETFLGAGDPVKTNIVVSPGMFGAGLRGGYTRTFEFGNLAFGFEPQLLIGFDTANASYKDAEDDGEHPEWEAKNNPVYTNFELMALVNLGVKLQLNDKFAMYTGASLRIFDLLSSTVVTPEPVDPKYEKVNTITVTDWTFDGFRWREGSTLNFGFTLTPIEGLVIGFETNILDKFFSISPASMTANTTLDSGYDAGNIGAWAFSFFSGLNFSLTVSYRFPSGSSE
jgi:hypothetical protein